MASKQPKKKNSIQPNIEEYVAFLKENESFTLPSGLGQDQDPPTFDYQEAFTKMSKAEADQLNFKNGFNFANTSRNYSDTFKSFGDDFFIINDVTLSDVPVLYNKFHSTNNVFVAETLRNEAPAVSSSGRQNWSLQLGLIFKPGETQSKKLHRLVSVLQKFPLTYIYNRRVREALGIAGGDEISTIFVLESANMRNASDAVGSIVLDLNFHLFNYKPFSFHYWFNSRLPGYKRRKPEMNLSRRLLDATGYEESAYSIENEAAILQESVREMPELLGFKDNVPVPFPASSDSWMHYADHLQSLTPPISPKMNDFIRITTSYYRRYTPPTDETRIGAEDTKVAHSKEWSSPDYAAAYEAAGAPQNKTTQTASQKKTSKSQTKSGTGASKQKLSRAAQKKAKYQFFDDWWPQIQAIAEFWKIDPFHLFSVLSVESGGGQVGHKSSVSSAHGLGQTTKGSWNLSTPKIAAIRNLDGPYPYAWASSKTKGWFQIDVAAYLLSESRKFARLRKQPHMKDWETNKKERLIWTDVAYAMGGPGFDHVMKMCDRKGISRGATMDEVKKVLTDREVQLYNVYERFNKKQHWGQWHQWAGFKPKMKNGQIEREKYGPLRKNKKTGKMEQKSRIVYVAPKGFDLKNKVLGKPAANPLRHSNLVWNKYQRVVKNHKDEHDDWLAYFESQVTGKGKGGGRRKWKYVINTAIYQADTTSQINAVLANSSNPSPFESNATAATAVSPAAPQPAQQTTAAGSANAASGQQAATAAMQSASTAQGQQAAAAAALGMPVNAVKALPPNYTAGRSESERTKWITAMEQAGLYYYRSDIQVRNVFYKHLQSIVSSDREYSTPGAGGIVMSAISVSFGHRLAAQNLLSQDTPSYQFLGAGNKQGTMVFTFSGERGRAEADNIKKIIYAARDNARTYSSLIPSAGTIKLYLDLPEVVGPGTSNSILKLLSKKDEETGGYALDVVVSEIHESTAKNNPDAYELVLEFIVQDVKADEGLERNFATSFKNKKKIISVIMSNIFTKSKEYIQNKKGWSRTPKYEDVWTLPEVNVMKERWENARKERNRYLGVKNSYGITVKTAYKSFRADSGFARPYILVDQNMPYWMANAIIEAVRVCNQVNKISPPTNWKDPKGAKWDTHYDEWGAKQIIQGKLENIDDVDRNNFMRFGAMHETPVIHDRNYDIVKKEQKYFHARYKAFFGRKYDYDNREDLMRRGYYDWDNGMSRVSIDNGEDGGETDARLDRAWDVFLDGMERVYRMVMANASDEENFSHYFDNVSDEIYENLLSDLGGCYEDLNVPDLPERALSNGKSTTKLKLPLPPEFFIYDDSHEDPALSSMVDPAGMEKYLQDHISNGLKSVKRYLEESIVGGSYLSKNLPNIIEQRKRYLEQFAGKDRTNKWLGEKGFLEWGEMMGSGCKTWDPIFHNEYDATFSDADKNTRKWMDFMLDTEKNLNKGNEAEKDIQMAWTDKLIQLSPYLRDGHTGVTNKKKSFVQTGWQDLGKNELIRTIYDNNWRGLSFGPNEIYAQVDRQIQGIPLTAAEQQVKDLRQIEEDSLTYLKKQSKSKRGSTDLQHHNITFMANGETLIGKSLVAEHNVQPTQTATNWWGVADTVVNTAVVSSAAVGNIAGALQMKAIWEGGNYLWDEIADTKSKYIIEHYKKKYHHTLHPVASKFSKDTKSAAQEMAQLASGITFGTKGKDLSMRRAFPTFKIYFIEDDNHQSEKSGGTVIKAFDDFYSYSAVQEIRISRNRRVAADMATIRITNIGGKLLRKRWGEKDKWVNGKQEISRVSDEYATGIFADTELENPFQRMMLQDGVKVQIRLGYANEPDNLDTVFLGAIVEMSPSEGGKIIELVCQGFGAELEGVELGPLEDGPIFYSSQQALSGAIIQDSIVNFGRRSRFNKFNPGETRHNFTGGKGNGIIGQMGDVISWDTWRNNKLHEHFYRYPFRNFPQDDNIYAPPPKAYADWWDRFWNNACIYRPLKQTPWDIFKEHELRHPGFISLAVPYGHEPRMTMFFGAKAQHYWAHSPSPIELHIAEQAANQVVQIRGMGADDRTGDKMFEKLEQLVPKHPRLAGAIIRSMMKDTGVGGVGKEVGRIFGRYKPFRNYHYMDSYHHILKNSIRTNVSGVFNNVDIRYFDDEDLIQESDADDMLENLQKLAEGDVKYNCKLDENIPEQYIRSYTCEYPSCITEFMAKRYAQGLFQRTLRDCYKGELIVLGDATIKPYDVCYLNDASINMTGPIEVEGVEHIFNRDFGWISVITPDMCVEVNDFFSLTMFDAVAGGMSHVYNSGWGFEKDAVTSIASPFSSLAIQAGVKLAMWMQDGSPVVATPLTLGGKPFVSAALGQDRVSLITQLKGEWNQYWDDLGTNWDKVDIADSVFEKTLGFQEWALTLFNPSVGEGIPRS